MTEYAHSPSCNGGRGLCSYCGAQLVEDPELRAYLLEIAAGYAHPENWQDSGR